MFNLVAGYQPVTLLKIPFLGGVTNYVILRNRNQFNAGSRPVTVMFENDLN